jgi:phosphoribosylformylglycinamidine (FGAM) synthase-like amidotransferase family enzyme
MDYKKIQLDEILFLITRGFSYGDVLSMPIFVRRYYVNFLLEKISENS